MKEDIECECENLDFFIYLFYQHCTHIKSQILQGKKQPHYWLPLVTTDHIRIYIMHKHRVISLADNASAVKGLPLNLYKLHEQWKSFVGGNN